jgi:CRISPR-associated endoribonuclease Cas6
MRIRIILGVLNKGGVIPFFHQPQIQEIFYCLMASTEYREFKGYSFSNLKGGTKVTNDGLEFTSIKATIIVSSYNSDFINCLKRQLQLNNSFSIGSLNLLVLTIEEELVINNFEFSTKYICLSPILVNDTWKSNNEYIDPFSDSFSDYLYESTMLKLEEFNVVDEEKLVSLSKFQIVPDKDYLSRLINDPVKFSKLHYINFDNSFIKVRVFSFPFTLFADSVVQRFIYNSGIGELNHFGLGLLDLARDQSN